MRDRVFSGTSTPASRIGALREVVQAARIYTGSTLSRELTTLALRYHDDIQTKLGLPKLQDQLNLLGDVGDAMQIDEVNTNLDRPKTPTDSAKVAGHSHRRVQASAAASSAKSPRGEKRRVSHAFDSASRAVCPCS